MYNFSKELGVTLHIYIYGAAKIGPRNVVLWSASPATPICLYFPSLFDTQSQVDIVYIDFHKVFDQLGH